MSKHKLLPSGQPMVLHKIPAQSSTTTPSESQELGHKPLLSPWYFPKLSPQTKNKTKNAYACGGCQEAADVTTLSARDPHEQKQAGYGQSQKLRSTNLSSPRRGANNNKCTSLPSNQRLLRLPKKKLLAPPKTAANHHETGGFHNTFLRNARDEELSAKLFRQISCAGCSGNRVAIGVMIA